ncbi:MAG TPA: DUF4012 domain-containing protein [Candidatus Bathyarchaeia archaeon]|nr:DUF4012 domain-containing protein [Candidatus Bathyarchaeia archaeon]
MVENLQKINLPQEESPKEKTPSVKNKEVGGKKFPSDIKGEKRGKKNLFSKLKFIFIPLLIIIFLLLLVGLPTYILSRPLISSAQKTYTLAQAAYQAGKNQDLVSASEKLIETEESLKDTQGKYKKMLWFKLIPLARNYYQDGERVIDAGLAGIQAARVLVDAITPYADVLGFKGQGSFMAGTAEDRVAKIVQTLDKITPQLDEVVEKLSLSQERLNEIDPKRYPEEIKGKKIRENILKAREILEETASGIKEAKPILNVLPQILGYPDSKDYLVIFQNDGELRATGGFMTAFSVLHIESGKVKAEKSDDIYSLDRKFTTRLKPPEPIKEYLFSNEFGKSIVPYYYLRDMNFSPDFKVSMDTFKQYYDKLPGEYKVDGIITVDTFVLKDLVDILGSINVPGYGDFTTEPDKRCHNIPNIICELEYIIDEPLPTQAGNRKQAILGPMMKELILKAMGSSKNLWPQLFSTGLRFLKEKHILLYFNDEKIQSAAEAFNAAGRIREYKGDYLHINDSNFGGAKSNMFTSHTVEQEVEIGESGQVVKTLTLIYENPESFDDCGLERKGGLCLNSILRDYIRIYVPKGSKLIEGLGSEVNMKTGEELGKTYFDGFLTVRGGGGRAKLVVKYELPFEIKQTEPYKLLIQKQPGTLGHKYKIIVGDQEEEFDLRTDREFEFSF